MKLSEALLDSVKVKVVAIIATTPAVLAGIVPSAEAEKPSFVISHPGQPIVAIFSGEEESYALGCSKLAEAFGGQVVSLDSKQWGKFLSKFPVAGDIHCDGRTTLYAPEGEPGAIVFSHRNGQYYRHYVSSPLFFEAIGGNPVPITAPQFRSKFPNRGVDFHR